MTSDQLRNPRCLFHHLIWCVEELFLKLILWGGDGRKGEINSMYLWQFKYTEKGRKKEPAEYKRDQLGENEF